MKYLSKTLFAFLIFCIFNTLFYSHAMENESKENLKNEQHKPVEFIRYSKIYYEDYPYSNPSDSSGIENFEFAVHSIASKITVELHALMNNNLNIIKKIPTKSLSPEESDQAIFVFKIWKIDDADKSCKVSIEAKNVGIEFKKFLTLKERDQRSHFQLLILKRIFAEHFKSLRKVIKKFPGLPSSSEKKEPLLQLSIFILIKQ